MQLRNTKLSKGTQPEVENSTASHSTGDPVTISVDDMTHRQLVQKINEVLAPIDLQFLGIRPNPRRAVLLLSPQPGFDETKSDAELSILVRSRLNAEPNVAEAVKDLDIVLK